MNRAAITPLATLELRTEKRMRPLMGTFCVVEASAPGKVITAALSQAFAAIAHIARCMHPQRAGSDLARLNSSHRLPVKVQIDTWQVLKIARELHELSNGIFDPCLPHGMGRVRDVELLPDSTVLCHAPVHIDLGGIAKGYAIDQAIQALRIAGCRTGLVNIGGDLRVFGAQAQAIFINGRHQSHRVDLQDAALAVSDVDAINPPAEHQGYYLRKAHRAPLHSRVAVSAPQAVFADALTNCLLYDSSANLSNLFALFDAQQILAEAND